MIKKKKITHGFAYVRSHEGHFEALNEVGVPNLALTSDIDRNTFPVPVCRDAAPWSIPALSLSSVSAGTADRAGLCHCIVTERDWSS